MTTTAYLSDREGWLYLAQRKKDGRLKVGWSSDPFRRAENNGWKLLKVKSGSRADEVRLHVQLRQWSLGREWYRDCPSVHRATNRWLRPEGIVPRGAWMPGGRLFLPFAQVTDVLAEPTREDLAEEDLYNPYQLFASWYARYGKTTEAAA